MAAGPITSWQIDGEKVETVADFIILDSKIPADHDCSHVIQRHLLLGREAMKNLHSVLKSRDMCFMKGERVSTPLDMMEEALWPDNMHTIKALPTYFVASNHIFFVLSKVGGF